MNNYNRNLLLAITTTGLMLLQSCQLITDIFAAGFWVGIVLTILIIVLIIWLIFKATSRRRRK